MPQTDYDPETFLAPHEQVHLRELHRQQVTRRRRARWASLGRALLAVLTYGPLHWYWYALPVTLILAGFIQLGQAVTETHPLHDILLTECIIQGLTFAGTTVVWLVYLVNEEDRHTR